MGATVLSKDEKEQRIYTVLLIKVPLYGSSIFSVFHSHTQTEKSICDTHTHKVTATANRFTALFLNADDA